MRHCICAERDKYHPEWSPACRIQHLPCIVSLIFVSNWELRSLSFRRLRFPNTWGHHYEVITYLVTKSFHMLYSRHEIVVLCSLLVVVCLMIDLCETWFYATHYSLRLYRLFDSCFGKGFYGFMIRCFDVIYHTNPSWHCMMIWTWIDRYTAGPSTLHITLPL